MNQISTENWNDLINGVSSIGDKTQRQLIELNAHIDALTNTLELTNIILGIIAGSYIISIIVKRFNKK